MENETLNQEQQEQTQLNAVPNTETEQNQLVVTDEDWQKLSIIAKWMPWFTFLLYFFAVGAILSAFTSLRTAHSWVTFFVVLATGVLTVFPASHSSKASKLYKHASASQDADMLHNALGQSARFWKFMGIIVIVYLCILLLFTIYMVVVQATR